MEIRGPNPNVPPTGPQGPGGPDKPEKTGKPGFREAMSAGDASAASGAAPTANTGGVSQPTFDRIAGRIQQGVESNQSKQEILQGVIDDELKQQYGPNASDEMTAAVTEKFQTDPQLSQLFNRLYAQATRGG